MSHRETRPTDPPPPLTAAQIVEVRWLADHGHAGLCEEMMKSLADLLDAHAGLTAELAQRTEEVEGLRKRIEELETPTLYWDAEDQEDGTLDIDSLLEMHEWGAGTVHEIALAHDLPNEWLVIRLDPKDEDGFITETYATEAEARAALAAPTEG